MTATQLVSKLLAGCADGELAMSIHAAVWDAPVTEDVDGKPDSAGKAVRNLRHSVFHTAQPVGASLALDEEIAALYEVRKQSCAGTEVNLVGLANTTAHGRALIRAASVPSCSSPETARRI